MSGFKEVIYFLITTLFNFALMLFWMRFALRYFKISALHPIGQLIYTLTNPITTRINSIFFPKSQHLKQWDWPCLASIVTLEIVKFALLGLILFGQFLPISYWLLYIIASLIIQPLQLLFYVTLIRAIMSFINPLWQHPLANVLRLLSEPFLEPIRRIVPIVSGFDLSPFVLIIGIKAITLLIGISLPLHQLGL